MNLWLIFWIALTILSFISFAGLAVIVAIRGFKYVKEILFGSNK